MEHSKTALQVVEVERHIRVFGAFDVVVLGGGPAGIAAAAAAARNGATVLLAERYGFLGGMGTAAGVTNFCGLHANVFGNIRQVVHGVAEELLVRMRALDGLNEPHLIFRKIFAQAYDMSAFKCAADGLLTAAGVRILFHALAAGVVKKSDGSIDVLLLETKSGRLAVRAKCFIDCSGDADIAQWAGVPTEKGDEHGHMLYPTLMFRLGNVDAERAGRAWEVIPGLMDEAEAAGEFKFPRRGAIVRPQKHAYEWRVNVTQLKSADGSATDGTDAQSLSDGELEGRRQIVDYLAFLRAKVPGFEHVYALDVAPQLGIRETRRLVGEYMLTEEDVLQCVDFPDAIGVNGWPLEKHIAGDVEWVWPPIPSSRGYNQLPYRMLLPRRSSAGGVDNLLVAGRCASMTHDGQSAARVTGACFVMGQAAGTAAAMAVHSSISPHDIDVKDLQRALIEQGAFLGNEERKNEASPAAA
ncbi:FAD-dependent oxidoreductase (plasmid) [Cupriavidus necator]|uniref:FAD-dependent oxidoreductase n=1 Tax=Cupriavidus necator TaxID=106590 RepID=A0A367PA50_CUPNE|nr:FAD-dependent oxidoreductase [Cupriavidus necator]QQX89544.1 FAD-dependent oxidoreductase [Cupriavidus necator]RCJ04097.1 FAD-dependent oxidoreductase [Cupriavidus necator]